MILPLTCLLLASLPAVQDGPSPHAATLARVLRAAVKPAGVHISGSATERTPEEGGGMSAIMIGAGGGGTPFAGDLDAWRTAKGELLVLSKKRLPEFALFDDGLQPLVRTTCADEALDVTRASADLTALLDLGALATAVEKQKQVERTESGEGAVHFACELPTRLVKSAGGVAQFASAKVLRIDAHFDLDAKGELVSMRFDVLRSDPLANIRRSAVEGHITGASAVSPSELSDDEGPTSVYDFKLDSEAPSKRAAATLESLREAAHSDAR